MHPGNRDERAAQLSYMSRMYDFAEGRISVRAGDFNARGGEDHVLELEGWRDAWGEAETAAYYLGAFSKVVPTACVMRVFS